MVFSSRAMPPKFSLIASQENPSPIDEKNLGLENMSNVAIKMWWWSLSIRLVKKKCKALARYSFNTSSAKDIGNKNISRGQHVN